MILLLIKRINACVLLMCILAACTDKSVGKQEKVETSPKITIPAFLKISAPETRQFDKLGSDTAKLGFLLKLSEIHEPERLKILHFISGMQHDSIILGYCLKAILQLEMSYVRKEMFDSALHYIQKGIELSKPYRSHREKLALFYREMGRYYAHHSDFANGIKYYNNAIQISERSGKPEENIMYNSELGSIYKLIEEYDKAMPFFLKAKAYGEKTGDLARLVYALNSMGDLARAKGQLDTAISLHKKAFEVYKKCGKTDFWALTSLGKIYTKRNEFNEAEKCFNYVLKEGTREVDLISQCYFNLARCDQKKGNITKAIKMASKAYEISLSSPDIMIQKFISEKLVELYKQNKQYEKALHFNFISQALSDSIENKEQIKKRAEAEFMNKESRLIEKNDQKLKEEENKRLADSKRHNIVVMFIGIILFVTLLFSVFIFRSLQRNKEQNIIINEQKKIVEDKQKETLDSIHYARRIQKALLASDALLNKNLAEYFILYKPKDIVSGDFYWAHEALDKFLLCIADCTGHGVPGAFMSLLNTSFLNEAILEKKLIRPDTILNSVRESVITTLNSEGNEESKDGMDCVLCSFDMKNKQLIYAAANTPFYIVRNGELIFCEADKMPVGKSPLDFQPFSSRSIDLQTGDLIYILTDGYPDQFGGPKGKKFKHKQLEEILIANYQLPLQQQHQLLTDAIEKWKGSLEQVDDILIIGLKI